MTVGGGPVGVPLPIGGTSAILGPSMTGPYPHSLVKRRGGEVTRVKTQGLFPSQHCSRWPSAKDPENRSLWRCRWPLPGGAGLPMVFWEGGPEGEPGHHDRQAHSGPGRQMAQAGLRLGIILELFCFLSELGSSLFRCVCFLLQDLVQSCLSGEGGILEDMCYERRRAEASVD